MFISAKVEPPTIGKVLPGRILPCNVVVSSGVDCLGCFSTESDMLSIESASLFDLFGFLMEHLVSVV